MKIKQSILDKTWLIIFGLCWFQTSHAATSAGELFSMSLTELLQVEITGSTLTEENIKTVPSAVTVFNHAQIRQMGLDSLDELMNLVPGFQSYRSSSSGVFYPFSVRGRRVPRLTQEVLIMVDGQRLDGASTSGSTIFVSHYPLKFVERVEFIRGPGAAVYGSNAMMGIVNIITRTDSNELSIAYGSQNRRRVTLTTSTDLGDAKFDLMAQIDKDEGQDYNEQDTYSANRINTDDPRELRDLDVKINWQNSHLKLQHHRSISENFYSSGILANGFNFYDSEFSAISLQQDFEWLSVNGHLFLSHNRAAIEASVQASPPGALAAISNPSSDDPLQFIIDFNDITEDRVQWHNDWQINDLQNLQLGVEYRKLNVPSSYALNNFDLAQLDAVDFPINYYGSLQPTTLIQASSTREVWGLYSQYQQQMSESMRLTLGLRYDNFSDIGSNLSPRLGLVYDLNSHHTVKFLYGEAFRAPTENEQFLQNNPTFQGNENLKPETVNTWDLIWLGQWAKGQFSLGYFENHFKDTILDILGTNGKNQFQNSEQGPSKGLEFEVSYHVNDQWLVRANLSHLTTKPDLSYREADDFGSFMLNYQNSKWQANLILLYSGEQMMSLGDNDTDRFTLDKRWTLATKIRYQFLKDGQVFLQVKNLLDNDYRTPSLKDTPTQGTPNRGREVLVAIDWSF